jgi:hypothetical protein
VKLRGFAHQLNIVSEHGLDRKLRASAITFALAKANNPGCGKKISGCFIEIDYACEEIRASAL